MLLVVTVHNKIKNSSLLQKHLTSLSGRVWLRKRYLELNIRNA